MTEESIHGQRNIGVEIQLGAQAGQTARKQPVCTIIGIARRETTTARSLAGIHREGQTSYHSTDSSYRTLHSCQHLMAQTVSCQGGRNEGRCLERQRVLCPVGWVCWDVSVQTRLELKTITRFDMNACVHTFAVLRAFHPVTLLVPTLGQN